MIKNRRLGKEYEFILSFEAWGGYNLWLFARKEDASRLKDAIIHHPQLAHIFNVDK
jgi:hypothetical protein